MAAIELPIPAPFSSAVLDIGYKQEITAAGSGFIQTFDRMIPMWYGEFRTPPLRGERYRSFESFLDDLEGAKNTFLAYDLRKIMPYAYSNVSYFNDPWGSPETNGYNPILGTFTLKGGVPNAVITQGDMFSVLVDNSWWLFRIKNTTAFDSGGAATLLVTPRPPVAIVNDIPIRYRRACAEMKIIGGVSKGDSVDSNPTFSFKAFQYLDRT